MQGNAGCASVSGFLFVGPQRSQPCCIGAHDTKASGLGCQVMDTIYEQIKGFLKIIWVRGQNIEIFIKNVKTQDLTLLFFTHKNSVRIIAGG